MSQRNKALNALNTHRSFMGMVSQMTRDSYGEPFLISQDEVTHRLAISRTTLWRLLRDGELEAIRIGSRTFVSTTSITEFLNRHSSRAGE